MACQIRAGKKQRFGPAEIEGKEGFLLDTSRFSDDQLLYHKASETYPVIVVLEADTAMYRAQHAEATANESYASCQATHLAITRRRNESDEELAITVLKQTISVSGNRIVPIFI